MAKIVLTDAYFEWNSVDLSDHVRSVTVNYAAEAVDQTAMGGNGTRENAGGLKVWSMDVELYADEASSSTSDTLFPDVGATQTVEVRATSAARSATNPGYTGTGLLENFNPIAGTVGDSAISTTRILNAGVLSRATS